MGKNYYSWKDIGSEFRAPELSAALTYSQLVDQSLFKIKESYLE